MSVGDRKEFPLASEVAPCDYCGDKPVGVRVVIVEGEWAADTIMIECRCCRTSLAGYNLLPEAEPDNIDALIYNHRRLVKKMLGST